MQGAYHVHHWIVALGRRAGGREVCVSVSEVCVRVFLYRVVMLQNRVLNRRTTHDTRKTRHSNVTTTPLRADEAWARALI